MVVSLKVVGIINRWRWSERRWMPVGGRVVTMDSKRLWQTDAESAVADAEKKQNRERRRKGSKSRKRGDSSRDWCGRPDFGTHRSQVLFPHHRQFWGLFGVGFPLRSRGGFVLTSNFWLLEAWVIAGRGWPVVCGAEGWCFLVLPHQELAELAGSSWVSSGRL